MELDVVDPFTGGGEGHVPRRVAVRGAGEPVGLAGRGGAHGVEQRREPLAVRGWQHPVEHRLQRRVAVGVVHESSVRRAPAQELRRINAAVHTIETSTYPSPSTTTAQIEPVVVSSVCAASGAVPAKIVVQSW